MIIDTHAHYLQPPLPDRPYHAHAPMAPISIDELVAEAETAGIDRIVQVTASTMGYDNRYSFEGAVARPDKVLGVIGRLDPLTRTIRDDLAAFAAQPRALGIRLTLFHDWSAEWLRERVLEEFLGHAAVLDVPIQIFAPFQNGELADTARRHPGVRFIVDHMNIRRGNGLKKGEAFAQWPKLITLAALPNVWIKVSYFPEAAMDAEVYPYVEAQERFRELYERVGAARLVWGSNYPPAKQACTYEQTLQFVRDECRFLDDADRQAILGGNFLNAFGGGIPRA